jgi:Uma2 family endonuclease
MATTRLMTIEDLVALGDEPGRNDLIRGELIRMSPAGARHGEIALNIGAYLWAYVREHELGKTYGAETGFILARNPDVLLAPDVAFVRAERLQADEEQSGFLELAPDLVVEIVSPSDRSNDVSDKVMEYLQAGVGLVWVVEPRRKLVNVYLPDHTSRILSGEDELDGGDVLPGFRLALSEIFR